jgi:ribosomal protein L44E
MNRAQKILELFGDIGGSNLRLKKDQKYLKCQSCGYTATMPSGVYGTDGLGDTTRAPLFGECGDMIQHMMDKEKEKKTGKFVDRGHMDYNPKTDKVERGFRDTPAGKRKHAKFMKESKNKYKCEKCGGPMDEFVSRTSSARVMQSGPRAQTAPGGGLHGGAYH